jgi:crotonobetainyl-CoA:carnitine CoA-transferase CaiB-like acyl-CoA transferase
MNGTEMGEALRKAADGTPRYAVYGAYRTAMGGIMTAQISLTPKSWDEAREGLAMFNKTMPNNASYFIGEYE